LTPLTTLPSRTSRQAINRLDSIALSSKPPRPSVQSPKVRNLRFTTPEFTAPTVSSLFPIAGASYRSEPWSSHDNGQHLLVHVDSRDPVRHRPLLGSGERAFSQLVRVASYRGVARAPTTLNYSVNHARSGPDSCSASTAPLVRSISPLHTVIVPVAPDFHYVSRAEGPG
jgi:hypothetical protein